jgi:hypothetical protein
LLLALASPSHLALKNLLSLCIAEVVMVQVILLRDNLITTMKTKIVTSILVVAAITLSFSFISVNKIKVEKKGVNASSIKRDAAPVGGLASSDKLD